MLACEWIRPVERKGCKRSAPIPSGRRTHELASVLLAAARLRDGDSVAASVTALGTVRFSPKLMAMATAVALDIAVATQTTDQAAVDEATSLLASGTVAPLDAARLWNALSAMHTQRGEVRAARDAASECQRVADALAASIPDSASQMMLLRESLLRPVSELATNTGLNPHHGLPTSADAAFNAVVPAVAGIATLFQRLPPTFLTP